MFNKIYTLIYILIFSISTHAFTFESYEVDFEGIDDEETLQVLTSVSQLIQLKDIVPASESALKRRAESDLQNILKALHSFGLFSAKIYYYLDFDLDPVKITFKITKDDPYLLEDFLLINSKNSNKKFPLQTISLKELGIQLHKTAYPKDIVQAEERLLGLMDQAGFPFAKIERREVMAHQNTKTIHVVLEIDEGPMCHFGKVKISGNKRVSDLLIYRKLQWKSGDIFNPSKLEMTQNALEQTALFKSISIEKGELEDDDLLPIEIYVQEAKHRSIGFGIGYTTDLGPGSSFEWELRNARKMGETVSLKTNVWQTMQEVSLLYMIPDFKQPKQDLKILADYEHERTKGYSQISYSLSALIERQLNSQMKISYGGMFKQLQDARSDNNRTFNLLKAPIHFKFSNTNNLLDPTDGFSFNLKMTPSFQLLKPQFFYVTNSLVGSFYLPLTDDHRLVFADKLTLGTILGTTHHAIPPSERFYAGSDSLLRGYHYLTVSPLNKHNKPVGGRSMLINSWELRLRKSESLGFCLFYEAGNVFESYTPRFDEKWLQSVGLGFRYFTPVGPIRGDLAFPLNRRKGLDAPCQFYISIGQAF